MLTVGTNVKGAAGYVALEHVSGTVCGQKGMFRGASHRSSRIRVLVAASAVFNGRVRALCMSTQGRYGPSLRGDERRLDEAHWPFIPEWQTAGANRPAIWPTRTNHVPGKWLRVEVALDRPIRRPPVTSIDGSGRLCSAPCLSGMIWRVLALSKVAPNVINRAHAGINERDIVVRHMHAHCIVNNDGTPAKVAPLAQFALVKLGIRVAFGIGIAVTERTQFVRRHDVHGRHHERDAERQAPQDRA
jgi:hypothetical protein